MDGMSLCKNVFRNIIISTYIQASKDAFLDIEEISCS